MTWIELSPPLVGQLQHLRRRLMSEDRGRRQHQAQRLQPMRQSLGRCPCADARNGRSTISSAQPTSAHAQVRGHQRRRTAREAPTEGLQADGAPVHGAAPVGVPPSSSTGPRASSARRVKPNGRDGSHRVKPNGRLPAISRPSALHSNGVGTAAEAAICDFTQRGAAGRGGHLASLNGVGTEPRRPNRLHSMGRAQPTGGQMRLHSMGAGHRLPSPWDRRRRVSVCH